MAYNNGMSIRDQRVNDFKSLMNTRPMMKRMTSACGSEENAKQFMASMLDLYEGESSLQNCDPQKVLNECLKAASLNLPLVKSLGFAYVVPYKNVPTFVIGYKGLIQLAQRSGQYLDINADAVYEGETVTKDRISGRLTITGTATSHVAIGYFGYFKLVNGFEKMLYMTKEEVEAYGRKYSKAYNNGPWKTEFDKMAMKTTLRQLLKYGPASTEMQKAERYELEREEAATRDTIQQNANQKTIDVPPLEVDESTGEVIVSEDDTASNMGPDDMEPVQAGIPGMGAMPDPGF